VCLALGTVIIAGSAPLLYLGLSHDRRGVDRAAGRAIAALPDDAHLLVRHEDSGPTVTAKYRIERRRSVVEGAIIRSLERRGLFDSSNPRWRSEDTLYLKTGPRYYAELRFDTPAGAVPTEVDVFAYIED
jgi:hypothetical protein